MEGVKDRDAGVVYYVLDASRLDIRVKIGTTTNLSERLKSLAHQTMSRQQPLVLALEDGGERREVERHQQFDRHRAMGEWFRYDKELMDHVASLPHPVG